MSSNSEFLHFKALINKFLNFLSSPILISSLLFFELTLSNIFIFTNFSLFFICEIVSDFKIEENKKEFKNVNIKKKLFLPSSLAVFVDYIFEKLGINIFYK